MLTIVTGKVLEFANSSYRLLLCAGYLLVLSIRPSIALRRHNRSASDDLLNHHYPHIILQRAAAQPLSAAAFAGRSACRALVFQRSNEETSMASAIVRFPSSLGWM